jgi:putative DNA methylase
LKRYPKRLIEVDLPIRRISAHARREKSIRHGHISTLHIWWARRPLAACRAVVCASLWPDPGDPICPPAFIETAQRLMLFWGREELTKCSAESYPRFNKIGHDDKTLDDPTELRNALLDFIADFANWNNSTVPEYLAVARTLTVAAHDALEGHNAFTLPAAISVHTLNEAVKDAPRPLLVDPFAGGGAIPLEGLRCGADAFASDLNPVAVLLNKVVMEYIPKYGEKLADEVEKWGKWIKEQAEKELAEFYPKDPDGATPIAYLWARTIQCEGPSCGMIIPLMNQRMISKRRGIGVELICGSRKIVTNIRDDLPASTFGVGTVTNGRVTCPKCGFTMTAERYRERSKDGQLGEMHYCTVLSHADGGRRYRNPSEEDAAALRAVRAWHTNYPSKAVEGSDFTTIPGEPLSSTEPRRLNVLYYGFKTWGSLFNLRQQLAWTTLSEQLHRTFREIAAIEGDEGLAAAVSTVLGLALSNLLQYNCSMSTWLSDGMISVFIQSSSIPMRADYAEANPLMQRLVGGLSYQLDRTNEVLRDFATVFDAVGTTAHASATEQILSDNSVAALVTDPPYYFAIPYAELSDFFYVWIKRFLRPVHPNLLNSDVTPKKGYIRVSQTHDYHLRAIKSGF